VTDEVGDGIGRKGALLQLFEHAERDLNHGARATRDEFVDYQGQSAVRTVDIRRRPRSPSSWRESKERNVQMSNCDMTIIASKFSFVASKVIPRMWTRSRA
jgi:hypothetical protein